MIRPFGTPALRATAHSPEETTFAPSPVEARRATTAGTSFALSENARSHGSGKASRSSAAAAPSSATDVTYKGVPYLRAAARSASPGAATAQSLTTSPTTAERIPSRTDATTAPTIVSDVNPLAGQPPMVKSSLAQLSAR